MITKLHILQYKPFSDYTVEFSDRNVLIGPNNAGKSTIVQVLRAADLALRFFNRTGQSEFTIAEDRIPFSLRNARNLYALDTEVVEFYCEFGDGESVTLRLEEPGEGFVVRVEARDRRSSNTIGFLPPVGPLEEDERLLQKETTRRTMNSYLAPRHFRNLWYHYPERIDELREQLALTWPGISLASNQPNPELSHTTGNLYMFYEENRSEREVAWAGTGFQIWMQILTFLVRSNEEDILVLDEPELYLHADVQRKIGVAALDVRASQVIIATHSVEIINEVDPEHIVTIDHTLPSSSRLFDVGAVQQAISKLGSTQNIQLSRLARTRKCLFVEGDDFKLLRRMGANLGAVQWEEGRDFSVFPLEGFERWPLLEGLDWVFDNVLGEKIQAFVILDRDYRTDSEIDKVKQRLLRLGVRCHIWEKKELENYLLVVELIVDAVAQLIPISTGNSRENFALNINQWLIDIGEGLRNETHANMLAEYQKEQSRSGKDRVTVNREFEEGFSQGWQSDDWRLSHVGGKAALRMLNQRLQQHYKVSVSTARLASAMSRGNVSREMEALVQEVSRFSQQ